MKAKLIPVEKQRWFPWWWRRKRGSGGDSAGDSGDGDAEKEKEEEEEEEEAVWYDGGLGMDSSLLSWFLVKFTDERKVVKKGRTDGLTDTSSHRDARVSV